MAAVVTAAVVVATAAAAVAQCKQFVVEGGKETIPWVSEHLNLLESIYMPGCNRPPLGSYVCLAPGTSQ